VNEINVAEEICSAKMLLIYQKSTFNLPSNVDGEKLTFNSFCVNMTVTCVYNVEQWT